MSYPRPRVLASHRALRRAIASFLAALAPVVSAQTSGTWTTNNATGNTGNWSDSTKWTATGVPSLGGNATFGAYDNDRTVTMDTSTYAISSLTIIPRTTGFVTKNFTLNSSGGGALQLGAGGLIIGNGGTTTISAPIELTANQVWTTNTDTAAGSVAVSGLVSGNFSLTRNALFSLPFTFSGANTFSGGFINNANNAITRLGANSTVAGGVITDGPLGTGTITLNAGTLSSNNATARTVPNNVVLAGVVTLGNSSQNGNLTFSDAGLTVPSTLTLAAANGRNVLRLGGTNLVLDTVVAESGATGQSLLISATSGTPTVTLNRTKTATGNINIGGVNLVLANGAAQPGALLSVGGSITATGANKFSSGLLVTDGTSLAATDITNFDAISGGKVAIYNNGRVSFAADQTQSTLAGLFTSDSQLRLGLGSGSANSIFTENYDQSALGNGKAGLVSASTGTVSYNGNLTAGSDNTFRIGGGLGILSINSALSGNGTKLIVEGGGTVLVNNNFTYNGTTTLNGTSLTLQAAPGVLSATTAVAVNSGATLSLTNATGVVNANRLADSAPITLNNGLLSLNGSSNATITETVGDLALNSGGRNFITVATTPGAGLVKTLQFGNLTRSNSAVAVFRGDTLGTTATARNEIKFSTAPALVGGSGAAGTTEISILPYARGGTSSGNQASGLVTYETNGVRQLVTGEYVAASNTSTINTAVGNSTVSNVRVTSAVTTGSSTVNGASTTPTVNALVFDNTGATGAQTFNLGSGTITVTSGAIHINQSVGQNLILGSGTISFGSAEGVITTNANSFLTTLNTSITGSGGLTISNLNSGGLLFGVNNSFTGNLTIAGNGYVGVDQDGRLGAAGGTVIHGGGSLQFFSGFTTTRPLVLLGNVGDNTLANNSAFTHTWNGTISGAGRLRLINNAGTPSTVGYVLGGNNTYTGGTLVEGIAVTGSTDAAFGTGTLSLQGGSNGAAAISLTSAAPILGGLRGTDGTITVNPTAATATLTIGAANDTGLFNGVITQSANKTVSLTKTGTGTLLLGGIHGYTGNTTISAGTLALVGGASVGASPVTLAVGGTLDLSKLTSGNLTLSGLSGSGVVNATGKALTVSSTYTPLALALTGNLTFGGSAQGTFIASTSSVLRSTTTVTGSVTNGGTLVITPDAGLTFAAGQSFPFVSATGGIGAGYSGVTVNGNALTANGGGVWSATVADLIYTYTESTATLAVSAAVITTPIQQWRITNFGNANNTGLQADTADFDGDGISNLLEYATNTNPTVANASSVQPGTDTGKLTLTFTRINDPALTYTVQGRDDLISGSWTTVTAGNNPTVGGPLGSVTVIDTVTIASQPRRFLRLSVTLAP